MTRKKRPHLYPSRKWWATQISASTTLTVAWVNTGHWSKPLSISAIGLVSQAAVAYLVPNATTPAPSGAEPRSSGVRRRASSRAAA